MGHVVKSVLIDLSGTLHIENMAINGSIEALKKLRESNVKIKFVTNTTKESRRFLHERLTKLGFTLEADEIFTSLHAARDLLQREKLQPLLLIDNAAWEDFSEFKNIQNDDIDAVVIGLAPSEFHYDQLNKAFRLIMKGAKLIAIHEARYFKQPDGLSLGPGPFVKGLEYATETKAIVVGKPTTTFFEAALNGDDPATAVMIGDDVRDDVGGAQNLGMKGFLVKTGKYRAGDEGKISPPPYAVCDNFHAAVQKILTMIN
ncbi:Haloacid dehalogenase-like hydrolase domain-containing protein 2 [Polyplax serrata]|uniref:Haloacid dehalogenase-like hydrolase domain-containing protein 2 n=1 Tax=Polyplax serrata TaxID=468196 RepID=A0AAN8PT67_POLSC